MEAAIRQGDLAAVIALAEESPFSIDAALKCALISDQHLIVEYLLQCGADPNARSCPHETPLLYASSVHTLRALLNAGARMDVPYYMHHDVLARCLRWPNCETMAYLIPRLVAAGADVDAPNGVGETPLHCALFDVDADRLVRLGADPTRFDAYGRVPGEARKTRRTQLFWDLMRRREHAPVIRRLYATGIHMDPDDQLGEPLDAMRRWGDPSLVGPSDDVDRLRWG